MPAPAHLTAIAMENLATKYSAAIDMAHRDPLIVVPLTILDFLCIHPFADGNGRVGRLLTLMSLYHFDYEVGRYIGIERVYEATQESYYETLEASSRGWQEGRHDPYPWLNYFWGVMLRAYREFEERVGVSRDTVRLVLRALKQQGLIASLGKGRSAKWIGLQNVRDN
jgi:Fic family protein